MLGVGTGPQDSIGGDSWSETGRAPDRTPTVVTRASRDAIAVLLSVDGLGPLTLGRLVERLGSPEAILGAARGSGGATALVNSSRAPDSDWRAMSANVAGAIVSAAERQESILASIEQHGLHVVAQGDASYPVRLMAIEIPPPALFVRGTLAPLGVEHVVAVVGTRRPSPAGRRVASRIAAALSRAEAVVVSGLAVGIDGAAHAAAVAEGSPTIAFIGGGHGRLYPPTHARLADAIVDGGGAVISEYAPLVEPSRGTFPQRNRLISGASDAVVVVEAGARSGALVTASWALEQGKECFIVPGAIDAPTSAGCNGFLREWAGAARCVSGIPQLLDDLGLFGGAGLPSATTDGSAVIGGVAISSRLALPTTAATLSGRSPAERDVAEALIHGAVTVDEFVAVTRRGVGDVLGALTRLEADGLARARYGRYEPLGALAATNPERPKAA